ncbi:hypothetical protein ABT146_34875, partial [Streptomyces sp. NPDC001743]
AFFTTQFLHTLPGQLPAGPVPRRVAALLGKGATASRVGRAAAATLLICLAVSGAAALDATYDLHSSIEVAQGESP